MLIYLASPYSHHDYVWRASRAGKTQDALVRLTAMGFVVFSPVALSALLVGWGSRPWDDPWWYEWSMAFLRKADEVWVLMLDDWQESVGVQAEIDEAQRVGKPVRYLDPETSEVRNEVDQPRLPGLDEPGDTQPTLEGIE